MIFKKIEAWILYLVILFSFLFSIGFGAIVYNDAMNGKNLGKISSLFTYMAQIPINLVKIIINKNEFRGTRFISKS